MRGASVYIIAQLAAKERPAFNVPWRPSLMQYAAAYSRAAAETRLVDPCMLAAIVQRESGGQNIFQEGIPAGPGCGVGLCQITYGVNWADPSFPLYNGENLLDPLANLRIAASVFLEPALEQFPFNHIAAFAAYNLGIGGVQEEIAQGLDPDALTTGNDYGHDVFANWINFVAASCGYTVDWSTWKDMNLLPSTQRIPATATP